DIKQVLSVSVKKFGGGDDVYNLVPIGQPKPETPYDGMWRSFKAAGRTDANEFKALVKSATGKALTALVDADVPLFEAALKPKSDGPLPPMTDEEKAAIEAAERGLEPGSGG